MKIFGAKLTDWVWVFYPILVVLLIMNGTNYLLLTGETNLLNMASQQEEIEAQEKIVKELRVKLGQLKEINREKALTDMQRLLEAMPANKKVWLVVGQMQDAATASNSIIASYKGSVGDVTEASESGKLEETYNSPLSLTVTYETNSFDQLRQILGVFESVEPLIKVNKIEYGLLSTIVKFDSAWLPWRQLEVQDVGTIVPVYEGKVQSAISNLEKIKVTPAPEVAEITEPIVDAATQQ